MKSVFMELLFQILSFNVNYETHIFMIWKIMIINSYVFRTTGLKQVKSS